MEKYEDFQMRNKYGEKTGTVNGILLEYYGAKFQCKNGMTLQPANIKSSTTGQTVTVYLQVHPQK